MTGAYNILFFQRDVNFKREWILLGFHFCALYPCEFSYTLQLVGIIFILEKIKFKCKFTMFHHFLPPKSLLFSPSV